MKTRQILKIASRGSRLALIQTEIVRKKLQAFNPELLFEICIIKTTGDARGATADKFLQKPLPAIGAKGLFTKEIEEALLAGKVDLAVHSLKDLPTEIPAGLQIGATLKRESANDLFLINPKAFLELKEKSKLNFRILNGFNQNLYKEAVTPQVYREISEFISNLPTSFRIGTSSPRRKAQLLHYNSKLEIHNIRGNLDTRLKKLKNHTVDALVLAEAGWLRLDIRTDAYLIKLPIEIMLPAAGQGALVVEIRENDKNLANLVKNIEHLPTKQAITAERAFLKALGGGCQIPIGAYAEINENILRLQGLVANPDGSILYRETKQGKPEEAAKVGILLAERMKKEGAEKGILF